MKNFKYIVIAVFLFVLLSINILLASPAEHSEINVVMDDNYPPFVFYDSDGMLRGILIDEWSLFEDKTGIKVNITAMNWSQALEAMNRGEYDVIDTIFKNTDREKIYAFTEPYEDIDVSIFFHKNISGINSAESLKGFTVAAKKGDQAINVLEDAGVENIELYDSYEAIIAAASENEVVIFAVDNPPARYFLYKYGLQDTFNHTEPLYTGQFHRAVLKENSALVSVIEDGFDKITPFERESILELWYGKSTLLEDIMSKYLKTAILATLVVLIFLVFWNLQLRLAVRKNTTDLSTALHQLKYNEKKLQAIIESMPDSVILINRHGIIVDYLTPHGTESLDIQSDEYLHHHISEFLSAGIAKSFEIAIEQALLCEEVSPIEYEVNGKTTKYFESRFSKLNDEEVISVVRDITDRVNSEKTIFDLSITDTPTSLFNRNYFELQLTKMRKQPLDGITFIMVDIDGLKLVNDTMGHDAGDTYLKTVADLLKLQFEHAEFVARIGGDEFIVVLRGWKEEDVLTAKLDIQSQIEQLNKESRMIPFSISLGFCTHGPDYPTVEDMIKCADDFMYREKLFHRQSTKSRNIGILSKLLEDRDFVAQGHIDRMSDLLMKMATMINYPQAELSNLALFAHFHDIGKTGISDTILFKPEKLTFKEYSEIKRHTEIGFRIAESSSELMPISEWIYKHHEWWDGSGYPFGLSGESIPLACRLLSIIDAYDAMTDVRPYRKPMSPDEAINEIKAHSGTQFDPQLVLVFLELMNKELSA
ncbi:MULTISPECIES: HD domain-containing phosphohydrolase [unclassified Fusibacter]|uniref:HD domain-containing phosphohydrolase n=1 Tax=unclassified Fusibacter TaxID=2624464 RepID=UPI0010104F4A|nr:MULTISPECIES: transporter substrate-binding domain-containing protein [unclassified Fusibacter]MCK8058346.1 transporter substrate-binding domain-containing protein [Fusibacter sp. A2]NPE20929.1 transporter substrate-binding domain-containing protein [Fusibacter sp. A1]RXV63132.1 diguanylate cyclase [Fusibacter sp. A1]